MSLHVGVGRHGIAFLGASPVYAKNRGNATLRCAGDFPMLAAMFGQGRPTG